MLQFTAFDKVYVFSSFKFCNLSSFTNEHLLQWRAWTRAEMSILETQHLTRQRTVLGDFWHSWHILIFWSSYSNYFSVVLDTTKIIFYLSFLSNFSHPGTSTKRTKQSKVSWQNRGLNNSLVLVFYIFQKCESSSVWRRDGSLMKFFDFFRWIISDISILQTLHLIKFLPLNDDLTIFGKLL